MFRFHAPWYALLIFLPFIVRLFAPARKPPEQDVAKLYFPAIHRIKQAFLKKSFAKTPSPNLLFPILFWLCWSSLTLALMQPEKVNQLRQVKNKGYDLMIAVDISASMQALDLSTDRKAYSRLDVTKQVVEKFVKGRQGDRIGLIAFGEDVYLHTPLTLDVDAVAKMLKSIISGMAGNATAIGDAIGLAVKSLRDRPEGSRVLILLTDGEDNASTIPPMEAAKLAKDYGIRIYTIGVGKNGPVPFPSGGGYVMAEMPLDEELLQKIAEMTSGRYFRASDAKMLGSVYRKINELEKTDANELVLFIRDPLYYYPLGSAVLCFFVLSLMPLTVKRRCYGI
jgi:Ca-activated chloride channel family protein